MLFATGMENLRKSVEYLCAAMMGLSCASLVFGEFAACLVAVIVAPGQGPSLARPFVPLSCVS